ncbi:MAG: DUF3533 domain-containing protein [Candidatus Micrarchaeia archaeon]
MRTRDIVHGNEKEKAGLKGNAAADAKALRRQAQDSAGHGQEGSRPRGTWRQAGGLGGAGRLVGGAVSSFARWAWSGARGFAGEIKCALDRFDDDASRFSGKWLMVLGLILIPALVFGLYVGAYYKPMDNMANTPVLVVNMDGGGIGASVENTILGTNAYQFRRATYQYAEQSISGGTEWAAIVIPEGFSDRIENGQDAQLELMVDDGRSYVATRVLSPTFTVLTERVNAALKDAAGKQVGIGLSHASFQEKMTSSQLGAAGSASGQIADAQGRLGAYTSTASSYSGEMASSGREIASNLRTAGYSADALRGGLVSLQEGSAQVQSGALALKNGTGQLKAANAALSTSISQSLALAGTLDNSSVKTQLLAALQAASTVSALESAGIARLDSGAASIYSGSSQVTSGLYTAASGAARLETGIFQLQDAQVRLSSSMGDEALSLGQVSEGQTAAAAGQEELSGGLQMLSSKQAKLASAIGKASDYSENLPTVALKVHESNKTDYGTFFATAFVALGLFFGAASAYLFCALTHAKRALPFAALFCLAQVLVLLGLYCCMGFPARAGIDALFLNMVFISGMFLMMTRAITYLMGDIFTSEQVQIMSPVLSLLAIFMISSGGAIWPQHTLNEPFSYFTPYIPFYYAVMAFRSSALMGAWPEGDIAVMLVFCVIFYVIRKLAVWLRSRGAHALKASSAE